MAEGTVVVSRRRLIAGLGALAVFTSAGCSTEDSGPTSAENGAGSKPDEKPAAADAPRPQTYPVADVTPQSADAPLIESVTPARAKAGDWVSVKGKRLKIVQCSIPNPEETPRPDEIPPGPDAGLWLKPTDGKPPFFPFGFNDPIFINGKREDGEWTDGEIYWQLGGQDPSKYKMVVKTNCALSNEVDFEILPPQ